MVATAHAFLQLHEKHRQCMRGRASGAGQNLNSLAGGGAGGGNSACIFAVA